ncbi:MAG: hypothetical protein WC986_13690 [Elusimicrobiota bacterium]
MSDYWPGFLAVVVLILEWWLGRTPRTRAGSILELAWLVLQQIARRDVVLINSTHQVSKETDEVLQLAASVIAGLVAKKPVSEVVASNVPALVKAMDGMELIAGEFNENPKAFCGTVGERLGEILGGLLATKGA